MSAMIAVSVMLAQATQPAITVEAAPDRIEVGYRELVAHNPVGAIERIRANRRLDADDPCAQINLGAAKARLGDRAAAHEHFVSALASRQRYDLELADGTWMDSRAAARLAIRLLDKDKILALR